MKNDMQLLITSRCKLKNYDSIEIKELDKDKELKELFYKHCPSAKRDPDSVSAIIEEVNCHTLTVCMAALTLEVSGMEPEELLQKLRSCGIGQNTEEIEVFKDEEFSYASMIGHLRMLMKLNRLNEDSIDILRNLSLLPVSGVYKSAFKMWLELDVKRPVTVMECLKSINRHIIIDNKAYYLLFLQDMYPYFDKYLDTDYPSELVERIEYVMNLMSDSGKSNETSKSCNSDKSGTPDIPEEINQISACDKALLLDYKAQLLFPRKEYDNAIKKYADAVFHAVMNENPDNDYSKSTARYLYRLYMRWGKKELAEQYYHPHRFQLIYQALHHMFRCLPLLHRCLVPVLVTLSHRSHL